MKVKLLNIVVLLTVLLSISASPATAQTAPVMDVPTERLTVSDLKRFVADVRQERVTVTQVRTFLDRITDSQKETVRDEIGVQAGIPLNVWRRYIADNRSRRPSGGVSTQTASWTWGPESVENYNGAFPYFNRAQYWYSDQYSCDDQPDTDFLFRFEHDANNPGSLRWNTNSSQVYSAFWAAYGGALNGFGYNYLEVHLCAGDNGVWAAGGADWVRDHLYLHYI